MAKKKAPKHYWDGIPTPERVAAFANENSAMQMTVLNVLRYRSSDAVAIYIAAAAVAATIFASGYAMLIDSTPLLRTEADYIRVLDMSAKESARLLFSLYTAALAVAALIFIILGTYSTQRIKNARVLLGAYESELERRNAARGWHARRWQREHSPDW